MIRISGDSRVGARMSGQLCIPWVACRIVPGLQVEQLALEDAPATEIVVPLEPALAESHELRPAWFGSREEASFFGGAGSALEQIFRMQTGGGVFHDVFRGGEYHVSRWR